MSSVPASVGQYRFSCRVTGLRKSTEYFYKACVTNGRNVLYSEWNSFVTPDTDPGPEPEPDPGPEPEPDPDPDPERVYRTYTFELTHLAQEFSFPLYDYDFTYESIDAWQGWVGIGGIWYGHLNFDLAENESYSRRECHYKAHGPEENLLLTIIQHYSIENIEFKCPVMKQLCVDLWDRTGDGELSYGEAVAVKKLVPEYFDVEGITSFDELRFFLNALTFGNRPAYLFEGSSLESVTLPYDGGYERAGKGMFKDCRELRNVTMYGLVVDDEMFMNCVSLREMDAIISGKCAFMGCTGLETVVSRATFVPEKAFKDCSSLSSFTFAEGKVEDYYVGAEAFYGCASLPEITIPRKVDRIGERAFYGCSSLKAVYLSSSLPPILGADVFTGTSPDLKIYVPSVLVDVYKSSWPALAEHIEARE